MGTLLDLFLGEVAIFAAEAMSIEPSTLVRLTAALRIELTGIRLVPQSFDSIRGERGD